MSDSRSHDASPAQHTPANTKPGRHRPMRKSRVSPTADLAYDCSVAIGVAEAPVGRSAKAVAASSNLRRRMAMLKGIYIQQMP